MKVNILDTFVVLTKKEVNILDTLDIILKLLDEKHLKQKDLTDYLRISKNAFTNWKNGSNVSYIKHLPQIADFFEVSVDYLLGKEKSPVEKLGDLQFALSGEVRDLTDEEAQDILNYIKFKKSQRK